MPVLQVIYSRMGWQSIVLSNWQQNSNWFNSSVSLKTKALIWAYVWRKVERIMFLNLIGLFSHALHYHGFHILFCCCCLVANSCQTLTTPYTVACRVVCPCDFPDKNSRVGCHFPLQGICLTQRSNPCLLQVSCIAGGSFTAEPPGKHILF